VDNMRKQQRAVLRTVLAELKRYDGIDIDQGYMEFEVGPIPFTGEPDDLRFLLDLEKHPAVNEVGVWVRKNITFILHTGKTHSSSTATVAVLFRGLGYRALRQAIRETWPDETPEWMAGS
jgi:hypothetical protein